MRDARSLPVPRRRGWHRKRRVWHRCRTACDVHARHAGRPCCTSHLPPEIRRPAPRGVLRAAVGRSSDSWLREGRHPHHRVRCFPGPPPQCLMRPRHHLPLRGSAGMGDASLDACRTGFPFHPAACGCRNRQPQDNGGELGRQHEILCSSNIRHGEQVCCMPLAADARRMRGALANSNRNRHRVLPCTDKQCL